MDVIEVVHKEVAMTQVAMRDPPLCLEPGYANEEGHARGMAAPEYGWFEVVNKTKQGGEIIAVLVSRPCTQPHMQHTACRTARPSNAPHRRLPAPRVRWPPTLPSSLSRAMTSRGRWRCACETAACGSRLSCAQSLAMTLRVRRHTRCPVQPSLAQKLPPPAFSVSLIPAPVTRRSADRTLLRREVQSD